MDSSLELDSGLVTAFAEETLVVETFEGICLVAADFAGADDRAVAFADTGLAGASSEEEDSSSSSDDSSLDSSLGLDSGLATAFAGEVLVADAFEGMGCTAADFVGADAFAVPFEATGLVMTSSEADDTSDDSSLDSSLELDAAAPAPFEGGAFTSDAFVGADLDCAGFVAVVPLAAALEGAALAGAALAAGFDSSSPESSLSESSSLSAFAGALVGAVFDGTAFEIVLVAFENSSESLDSDSEASDSLSLDLEEELALGGGSLDYIEE